MSDIDSILNSAQDRLNLSLSEYEDDSSMLAHEFRQLKLQASIFQYEICVEMAGFIRNNPQGFSRNIALKGLIHRIYEYDSLLNSHLVHRMLSLAKERGMKIDSSDIKSEKKKWKGQLNRLKKWSDIRNEATGHYGKNLISQVNLVKSIDENEVMSVTQAFLSFNMSVLRVLLDAGKGNIE